MAGVEPERVSQSDTQIGLLSYFQESTRAAWNSHREQHDLEDKALELAVNGVKDALALAVQSVRDDQTAMRELLETRIAALAVVIETYDKEGRARSEARREHIERDAILWREDHLRMHEVLSEGTDSKHEALNRQSLTYDSESRARWDNHYKAHDSQEAHGQEWIANLKLLQDEKQTAHEHVHSASQRAIDIADKGMTEKLGEMNNLRTQITAERGSYVSRDMLDSRIATASEQTSSLSKANEARLGSLERSQNIAYGIMLVLVFAIPLGLKLIP